MTSKGFGHGMPAAGRRRAQAFFVYLVNRSVSVKSGRPGGLQKNYGISLEPGRWHDCLGRRRSGTLAANSCLGLRPVDHPRFLNTKDRSMSDESDTSSHFVSTTCPSESSGNLWERVKNQLGGDQRARLTCIAFRPSATSDFRCRSCLAIENRPKT